jgi:hypothetical protein
VPLDPDPRAFRGGATLPGLVRARDPTIYNGHRLHRIRPEWVSLRLARLTGQPNTAHQTPSLLLRKCPPVRHPGRRSRSI